MPRRLLLPSERLRATKVLAGSWTRSRVIAIRFRAALSCRLPRRFGQWGREAPEDACSGATPACIARRASVANRSTFAIPATSLA